MGYQRGEGRDVLRELLESNVLPAVQNLNFGCVLKAR